MRALLATLLLALGALPDSRADAGPAEAAATRCEQVVLALAPGITPEVIERDWGSGETHAEANAALELRGCRGELLDRLPLPAPLARLEPRPLHGTLLPTWLVSADLTAPAGSTSGPLTLPVEVADHHLRVAQARLPAGTREDIRLPATGKAAWRAVTVHGRTELLAIDSRNDDGRFVTTWRRFRFDGSAWTVRERRTPGLWESDADFPAATRFP